jgi:hypothetical protein
MELKQEDVDAKDQAEYDKRLAEAKARDDKTAKAEAERESQPSPQHKGRAA